MFARLLIYRLEFIIKCFFTKKHKEKKSGVKSFMIFRNLEIKKRLF